jgi:hypothetical protein
MKFVRRVPFQEVLALMSKNKVSSPGRATHLKLEKVFAQAEAFFIV